MEVKCPKCGAPLENGRCGYCGYVSPYAKQKPNIKPEDMPQPNNYRGVIRKPVVSRKRKTSALLLCIFGGYLGLHRFYAGKVGSGFVYLFTGGCFGIGWIVDIILIATGSFKDASGLPLR